MKGNLKMRASINYEDVDGNEMYQSFELKDFEGTLYYALEGINEI